MIGTMSRTKYPRKDLGGPHGAEAQDVCLNPLPRSRHRNVTLAESHLSELKRNGGVRMSVFARQGLLRNRILRHNCVEQLFATWRPSDHYRKFSISIRSLFYLIQFRIQNPLSSGETASPLSPA